MTSIDATVIKPVEERGQTPAPPIEVFLRSVDGNRRVGSFTRSFLIGRAADCDVRVVSDVVSRRHAEVFPEHGGWWIRDLHSGNGIYVAGRRATELQIGGATTVELGSGGPQVRLRPPESTHNTDSASESVLRTDKLLKGNGDGATTRTRVLIDAIKKQKRVHRRQFLIVGFIVLVLSLGVGKYIWDQRIEIEHHVAETTEFFYDMKELELDLANLQAALEANKSNESLRTQFESSRRKLFKMRQRYANKADRLLASRFRRLVPLDSEERIILHMARVFGESDLEVPAGFVAKVKEYISKWKSSPRYRKAIERLKERGYGPKTYKALTEQGLPPQFMYLAMQESDFRAKAVGPWTRWGRAKGMWQFIPDTARRYGLKTGPLVDVGRYDPKDERHDPYKSTLAAARYLNYIYRTDAKASGLLVMASYNWGEHRIIKRLRAMPDNPRERNFWALISKYRIPDETYHYVYYIFAAAVIGENPRLFGFDFDNPLSEIDANYSTRAVFGKDGDDFSPDAVK